MAIDENQLRCDPRAGRRRHPGRLCRRAKNRRAALRAGRGTSRVARDGDPPPARAGSVLAEAGRAAAAEDGVPRQRRAGASKSMFPSRGLPYRIAHRAPAWAAWAASASWPSRCRGGTDRARSQGAGAIGLRLGATGTARTDPLPAHARSGGALSRSVRGAAGPLDRAPPGAGLLAHRDRSLPEQRDEIRLLRAMGFETANVHLGSVKAKAILKDLKKRKGSWLHRAAHQMAAAGHGRLGRLAEGSLKWRYGSPTRLPQRTLHRLLHPRQSAGHGSGACQGASQFGREYDLEIGGEQFATGTS